MEELRRCRRKMARLRRAKEKYFPTEGQGLSLIGPHVMLRSGATKHLDAYLDELEWRFNNRKNPYLFRDTLLKLLSGTNLDYKELTS